MTFGGILRHDMEWYATTWNDMPRHDRFALNFNSLLNQHENHSQQCSEAIAARPLCGRRTKSRQYKSTPTLSRHDFDKDQQQHLTMFVFICLFVCALVSYALLCLLTKTNTAHVFRSLIQLYV